MKAKLCSYACVLHCFRDDHQQKIYSGIFLKNYIYLHFSNRVYGYKTLYAQVL